MAQTKLKRTLTVLPTALYGLGNILGAGIYVLIGVIAGLAGYFTPLSFLIALFLALFTAFSYMEFSSRFPLSSGEAYYIFQGFKSEKVSQIVGLLIVLAGLVSAATLLRSFVGYFQVFFDLPTMFVISSAVLLMGLVAALNVDFSVKTASFFTLIEIFGLLIILWVARGSFVEMVNHHELLIPSFDLQIWQGILLGGFLAFYAFIGFEDMVTIAEEVKEPEKNMPKAIMLAFVIAIFLYITISLVAVYTVNPTLLSQSDAPMSLIYEQATGSVPVLITFIGIFAVVNGSLVQIIKVSRMLYGMSKEKWLPKIFSEINPKTQTPVKATIFITVLVLLLALFFPVVVLATTTSLITLLVFVLINLSLVNVKLRGLKKSKKLLSFPVWVPGLAFILSAAMVVFKLLNL